MDPVIVVYIVVLFFLYLVPLYPSVALLKQCLFFFSGKRNCLGM